MNVETFIEHLKEAIESLENEASFDGPYTDVITHVSDGVYYVPFEDGSTIRLSVEVLERGG
ncbi:MAG: hypothetical protein J7K40_12115 [candidate division Zixibacteria bacterium]|nr:hypothetical protein [candidate division Zixibacteria bacterium]